MRFLQSRYSLARASDAQEAPAACRQRYWRARRPTIQHKDRPAYTLVLDRADAGAFGNHDWEQRETPVVIERAPREIADSCRRHCEE